MELHLKIFFFFLTPYSKCFYKNLLAFIFLRKKFGMFFQRIEISEKQKLQKCPKFLLHLSLKSTLTCIFYHIFELTKQKIACT